MIFDQTQCTLGEGPLWHPEREQLFWFDILGKRLHTSGQSWGFSGYVSAAGWVDRDTLLIASQTALHRFDILTGASEIVLPLEAANTVTRSNDGRADPYGGFWIGTMGINAEEGAGAIYRYYKGELRQLFAPITIPNAICFAPDGGHAYFTDTPTRQIMRVALDGDGWPKGDPLVWLDLRAEGLNPDGAVVDTAGNLWNAQWGAGRVACYGSDGTLREVLAVPASQTTCPAFGGPDLSTLYVTSAAEGLTDPGQTDGQTFVIETEFTGQREHRVAL